MHGRRTSQKAEEIDKVADFADDAPSTLLRIVQPVVCGKEARVHAIVEREWFPHVVEKTLQPHGKRGKTSIEADHEKRARRCGISVGRNNSGELGLVKAKRLFAENMLAGTEGCDYLRGMKMMACGNDDGIDVRVVKNLPLIRGAGAKTKLLGGMPSMRAVRGAGHNHINAANAVHRGQQSAGGKVASPEKTDPN